MAFVFSLAFVSLWWDALWVWAFFSELAFVFSLAFVSWGSLWVWRLRGSLWVWR